MLATALGVALLAFFAAMPLVGLHLGAPWASLAISFALIPLLDAWVGRAKPRVTPPPPIPFVRWIPRLQLPLQAALLAGAVAVAPTLSWGTLIVLALAVGSVTGGLGITIAHELGHRASRLDRAIAKALLVMVCDGTFHVEHIRGHHVRVGTPEDPATAPRGMSLYRFLVRSVVGSFVHAWRLEALRLAQKGRSPWHLSNWALAGSLLSLALLVVCAIAGGAKGAALFTLQAVWAIVLLETINYIEHYGLQRDRVGDRFEPVREVHSWDADFTVSNWVLFNLQLHADHHANMRKPFEQLSSSRDAPQLPAGYPAMVLAAWLPPLWFALMNPRIPRAAGNGSFAPDPSSTAPAG
jgi:alkane 1-monooxygenase